MSDYSIVEAKNNLSALVEKVNEGEDVTITRHGRAVAELKPPSGASQGRPMTKADLDWLKSRRIPIKPGPSAVEELIRMRDEDDERLFRR